MSFRQTLLFKRYMVDSEQKTALGNRNGRIHTSITIAVIVSLLVIVAGIWNSYETGLEAEHNIKDSLQLQRISDALRLTQETMNQAVEMAVVNGQAQWVSTYEASLTKLQLALEATDTIFAHQIILDLAAGQSAVIDTERQLFDLILHGKTGEAFSLLASEGYQNQKIKQEQDALTLRAMLDRRASDIIEQLKANLGRTTFALMIQIALIIVLWAYVIRIISNWKKHQDKHSAELTQLAHYDTLTGIGNRALFQLRLEGAFQQSRRENKPVGLVLMDIDHFKDINDNLGHAMGDQLLKKVASELHAAVRETDTVVRLGGDEFAIIATNFDRKRDSAILGNKILSIFRQPLQVPDFEIQTGTSIGLAFYPDDAQTADELLRKADLALYEAKRNGRNNFKYFDPAIEVLAKEKSRIKTDLQEAIASQQFVVFYQPIIDIAANRVVGVESLIRWQHPERGMIPPDEFIPIAEESRLIIPIGEWVLRHSCNQQVEWIKKGLPSLTVAVNLSGVQFNDPELLSQVERTMCETGIGHNALTLEITESTLMQTADDLIAKLHALKDLGLKLAIDDFGTGYSSLAYLKRFPIHHLKIDREFVKDLPDDSHDVAIARSIIKMAHELGINVVAEGIETQAQLRFLNDAACNFGQGYYYGRPMPAAQFEEWYGRFASKTQRDMRAAV